MLNSNGTDGIKGVVILGSARSDGNTRVVVDSFVSKTGFAIADLNDREIGFFDYQKRDRKDDFLPLVRELLQYDVLVFATPVYWYAMSAVMKNFFDRITDLLHWHKDLGRQLRTKSMAVISCGSDAHLGSSFNVPFINSADYLGMDFKGAVHTWIEDDGLPEHVDLKLTQFADRIC